MKELPMTNFDEPINDRCGSKASSDHDAYQVAPTKMIDKDQPPVKQTVRNQVADRQQALKKLAMSALGKTGADIERLIREARQKARRQERQITYVDIYEALTGGQQQMSTELLWRISIHEAGHALALIAFELGTIQTMSVGNGAGGYIDSQLNQYIIHDEKWVNKMIAFTLAGRAAEILIFGDAAMGSGGSEKSDLAQATSLAIRADTCLGFGQEHPLLYRNIADQTLLLTRDKRLAQQVHKRLEAAEKMASDLLAQHKGVLQLLANELSARKVLDGEDVRTLIGSKLSS